MKDPTELATNVTPNVLNVPYQLKIVTPVPQTESKVLNQIAHAQVINTRVLMDIVPNVHSDVANVSEPLTIVMVKNVLTGQESWTTVGVLLDIMKSTRKKNVKNVKPSVQLVPLLLTIVTPVPKVELTQSQNAHAQPDNTKTEKRFAKIVLTNVSLVLMLLQNYRMF